MIYLTIEDERIAIDRHTVKYLNHKFDYSKKGTIFKDVKEFKEENIHVNDCDDMISHRIVDDIFNLLQKLSNTKL